MLPCTPCYSICIVSKNLQKARHYVTGSSRLCLYDLCFTCAQWQRWTDLIDFEVYFRRSIIYSYCAVYEIVSCENERRDNQFYDIVKDNGFTVIDDNVVVQNITEELHSNRTAIDTLHEQASNLGEQVSCYCDAVLSSALLYTLW